MKRPAWATVVGIAVIVFACLGVFAAGQQMLMPDILEMQKEIFSSMNGSGSLQEDTMAVPEQVGSDTLGNFPFAMSKMMEKMFDFPDWFRSWAIGSGILKIFVSGLYLFAGISFLQTKPISIPLFYRAAGLSIGLTLIRGIVALSALSLLGMAMVIAGLLGIVIDVVLVIVVATSDKEAFMMEGSPPFQSA